VKKPNGLFRVAIIGRPNVGKSTLFNRIVGRRHAITESISGTTRDRVSAIVSREGATFEIVDTGGFDMGRTDQLSELVKKQIEIAIEETDLILFVCDVSDGVTPLDEEIFPILRKSGKDIMFVVNKLDNERLKENVNEFFAFGAEDLYTVSALHNIAIYHLVDKIAKKVKSGGKTGIGSAAAIKIAVVGRPNVGKSSIVNRLLNEERVIVHEKPGTTRDSIDIYLNKEGTDFILMDTAGMCHKRKIKEVVDIYGLARARKSIMHSDISIIIIDAYEGLTRDDIRVLKLVEECGKGCILVVNKWDLISDFDMSKYEYALIKRMHFIRWIPILFTSCKTGLNLEDILRLVKLVYGNIKLKFSDEELAGILELIQKTGKIPMVRSGKLIKLYNIKQEDKIPPTFNIYVNNPASLTDDYVGAIKNALRNELGLRGIPIKINIKKRSGNKKEKDKIC
jgi:GTP-binding protein